MAPASMVIAAVRTDVDREVAVSVLPAVTSSVPKPALTELAVAVVSLVIFTVAFGSTILNPATVTGLLPLVRGKCGRQALANDGG